MNSLEKWKTINGLEVSTLGRVKSNNKLLKGELTKGGYIRIKWSRNGVIYRELLHRLIAKAFLPNPNNYPVVNHLDGNKQNNTCDNLEWCSYGANLQHAFKIGLRNSNGINNPASKLTVEQVLEIRSLYVKGKHCEFNANQLAERYNVSPRCITNVVKRKTYKNI
jgi:hypothetical protein